MQDQAATEPSTRRSWVVDAGTLGAVVDVAFALILTGFLAIATESRGDAVPRPLVLLVLYLAPAAVAGFGLVFGRPALLVAAGLLLVLGSVLSFAGVTLIFLVPAGLLLWGARAVRARSAPSASIDAVALAAFGLIVAAGWAVLLGFTEQRCFTTATGSGCGSGLISPTGLLVGGALIVLALGLVAWSTRRAWLTRIAGSA